MRHFVVRIALAAVLLAFSQSAPAEDRRRQVGGWLVEDVAEDDGGFVVRLTRVGSPYRLEYYRAYWRGNGGPIHDLSAARADVYCGSEVLRSGGEFLGTAAQVRARFTAWLGECGTVPDQVAEALRDLEAAFELFAAWGEQADAAIAAEIAEILSHGETSPAPDPRH